jgi:alcohol dehydrogenase, propanol-preferring
MGVQLAKAMGYRVIAIDAGSGKRKLCTELGSEAFIDFRETRDVPAEVRRLTGGKGVNGVFVTASSPTSYAVATKMACIGGKIMCVGMPASGTAVAGDDPMFLILRNLKVIGTLTGSLKDTDDALSFAARGLLRPIYETFSISRLPEAIDLLMQGKVAGRCVIDFNASD